MFSSEEAMPDLLPDDFGTETVTPPLLILREQAEHLSKRTGGLVVAKVTTQRDPAASSPAFIQRFVLEVPSLDDYAFALFSVNHPVALYPLDIWSGVSGIPHFREIKDQEKFEDALRQLFARPEVRKIVAALKAQAAAAVGTETKP